MSKLEQLTPNASIRGILPDGLATVVNVQWFGSDAIELTYKCPDERVVNELRASHRSGRSVLGLHLGVDRDPGQIATRS